MIAGVLFDRVGGTVMVFVAGWWIVHGWRRDRGASS